MGSKVSVHLAKTSLKIPKGQPESTNQRRIDKTMAKRKRTKGQITSFRIVQKFISPMTLPCEVSDH